MAQQTRSSAARRKSSPSGRGKSGSSSSDHSSSDSPSNETDRYRRAAEDALQQLDWAIGYLHGIHKTEISKALARNRTHIRTQLMGEHDELPTEETEET